MTVERRKGIEHITSLPEGWREVEIVTLSNGRKILKTKDGVVISGCTTTGKWLRLLVGGV